MTPNIHSSSPARWLNGLPGLAKRVLGRVVVGAADLGARLGRYQSIADVLASKRTGSIAENGSEERFLRGERLQSLNTIAGSYAVHDDVSPSQNCVRTLGTSSQIEAFVRSYSWKFHPAVMLESVEVLNARAQIKPERRVAWLQAIALGEGVSERSGSERSQVDVTLRQRAQDRALELLRDLGDSFA